MGLDATVMCDCFEKGRTTDPPVPRDWLAVDPDGYLSLIPERESGELASQVDEWMGDCCGHPGMEYASEHIANWSGYRRFQEALEGVGWANFPVLRAGLPDSNGGLMSPAAAAGALEELAHFTGFAVVGSNAALVNSATGEAVFHHIAGYEGVFILDGKTGLDAGVGEFEFFVRNRRTGADLFRATRFSQAISRPDPRGGTGEPLRVEYVDLDTGERLLCNTAVSGNAIPWPDGRMQDDGGKYRFEYPEQLHVEIRTALPSDFAFVTEPLVRVLRASVETGNPVRWC